LLEPRHHGGVFVFEHCQDKMAAPQAHTAPPGRPPHAREATDFFDLIRHATNMLDAETLRRDVDLSDVPTLTDDYAPVDTLALHVEVNSNGR
jgi:hypothetical protein